jgi:putative spermidine/putrescine transport system substrate-binding protein
LAIGSFGLLAFAGAASADSMSDLVAAAKKEGQLTIIAVPHDWCGYGAIIEGFKATYGLKVNELNPDAGSGDEIEAIKANKGNKGPQAPDVIDVGLPSAPRPRRTGCCSPTRSRPGHDPRRPEGCRGLVRRLLRAARLEINADLVKKLPTDWPDCSTGLQEFRSPSAAIRALQ